MAHADVIRVLGALARDSSAALASDADAPELAERYIELRVRAAALNHQHGWATEDEFATMLPTLESLHVIGLLDSALGQPSVPDLPVERGTRTRLDESLTHLAAWATGLRMAYETLEQTKPGPAGG
jgi:hypothetical protein